MSLDHQNATANITIDGLAICCFNQQQRLWEVGFMRHDEHELILRWAGGTQAVAVPVDTRVIRIETVQGETPNYKQFPLGFFDFGPIPDRKREEDSLTMDEKENFRWAMNLDDGADVPHGEATLKPPGYPVTMVYISDAVFYTAGLTPKNMFLVPLANDPTTMSERALNQHLYGKTADEIGADIKVREGGKIRITVDDKEVASLEHRQGEPWSISLMNMRKDHNHHGPGGHMAMAVSDLEQGDFQIYYDSLEVTGDPYSLWGHRPPSPSPLVTSGRTDCNTPWIGGDNLDGMTG
jgi:hypothetical protein